MTDAELRRLLDERARRSVPREGAATLIAGLLPQQQAFMRDQAKRKAALCSRRAGKTHVATVYMLDECMSAPSRICLYVGLTRMSAKRILWDQLVALNQKHALGIKFNHSELVAICPNGSKLIVTGADKAHDIEKFRGSAYRLVVLDECASFGPHIRSLIDEVLSPALLDQDGSLVMLGTPSAACRGVFYEATTRPESGWSAHKWTVLDNLHVPHAAAWLAEERKRRGLTEADPAYLREYGGLWVRSDTGLVYRFRPELSVTTETPPGPLTYVIGCDVGWRDSTAIVVAAYGSRSPCLWFVEMHKAPAMLPTEVANRLRELLGRFQPATIVMDHGGLGKSIAEEFKAIHGLPVTPAEKTEKRANIEMFNDDLRRGIIKVRPGAPVIDEWEQLQWITSDKDPNKLAEDPTQHNDCADACLYAWRHARHYLHNPADAVDRPPPDDPYFERLQEQMAQRQAELAWDTEPDLDWE